jgi:hypothetical protein
VYSWTIPAATRQEATDGSRRIPSVEGVLADSILDGPHPPIGAVAIKRVIALRFDERFRAVEDAEWWLRAARISHVSAVPDIGYIVRKHTGTRGPGLNWRGHLEGGLLLLEVHADYFATHPVAAHRRWPMIWQSARGLGEHKIARRAALHAFRLRPTPKTAAKVLVSR